MPETTSRSDEPATKTDMLWARLSVELGALILIFTQWMGSTGEVREFAYAGSVIFFILTAMTWWRLYVPEIKQLGQDVKSRFARGA